MILRERIGLPQVDRLYRGSGEDAMRPEYDFSRGKRGVTTRRYAQGGNAVVVSAGVGAAEDGAVRSVPAHPAGTVNLRPDAGNTPALRREAVSRRDVPLPPGAPRRPQVTTPASVSEASLSLPASGVPRRLRHPTPRRPDRRDGGAFEVWLDKLGEAEPDPRLGETLCLFPRMVHSVRH